MLLPVMRDISERLAVEILEEDLKIVRIHMQIRLAMYSGRLRFSRARTL
jgi:hypothetical protein